jgi:hypothetical protein
VGQDVGDAAGVARPPLVPVQLTKRPFSLDEARAAGITLSALKGRTWRRLGNELYCWSRLTPDPLMVLGAWQRSLPEATMFGGASAAWLLGLDLAPLDRVEIVAPPACGVRPQAGLRVMRGEVPAAETVKVRGLRATALSRTLRDLCLRRPPVEALIAIDMAMRARLTDRATLHRYCGDAHPGSGRLRALSAIAAPADSPMETRLRWLLLQAGLPKPQVQAELVDGDGHFVGRVDLYYPSARLALEYDGENHRDRMVEDNRRQNLLLSAGYHLLRFSAADIFRRPEVVVALVKGTLDVKRAEFSKPRARLTSDGRN